MKLLVLPEVMERTRRSKSSIYRDVKRKVFPAPVKQGESSFWLEQEIDAYLAGLSAARPASQPTPASS